MTDKQKLDAALKVIKTLREDAKLALSGDWNKSDDGFESQMLLIDKFYKLINEPPRSKFKQTKMDI